MKIVQFPEKQSIELTDVTFPNPEALQKAFGPKENNMENFLNENFNVAKASIETTISELIDMRDTLDNAGVADDKYQELLKVIEAYEELRRHFLDKCPPTDFEKSEWCAIFVHRLEVLKRKQDDLYKAVAAYTLLVSELNSILNI